MRPNRPEHQGPPPPNYVCHRCAVPGHWIYDCPTQFQQEDEAGSGDPHKKNEKRVRPTTGIPKSFLQSVDKLEDGKNALITSDGKLVVATANELAWQNSQKFTRKALPSGIDMDMSKVPDDLKCPICQKVLSDASRVPCCHRVYCSECIDQALLRPEPEHHFVCPGCQTPGIVPDKVIADNETRKRVGEFMHEYASKSEKESNANAADTAPLTTTLAGTSSDDNKSDQPNSTATANASTTCRIQVVGEDNNDGTTVLNKSATAATATTTTTTNNNQTYNKNMNSGMMAMNNRQWMQPPQNKMMQMQQPPYGRMQPNINGMPMNPMMAMMAMRPHHQMFPYQNPGMNPPMNNRPHPPNMPPPPPMMPNMMMMQNQGMHPPMNMRPPPNMIQQPNQFQQQHPQQGYPEPNTSNNNDMVGSYRPPSHSQSPSKSPRNDNSNSGDRNGASYEASSPMRSDNRSGLSNRHRDRSPDYRDRHRSRQRYRSDSSRCRYSRSRDNYRSRSRSQYSSSRRSRYLTIVAVDLGIAAIIIVLVSPSQSKEY